MTKKLIRRRQRTTPALVAANHRGSFNSKHIENSAMTLQQSIVLERLNDAPLTKLEAVNELGIFTLAQCIHELRKLGYDITTNLFEVETRYGVTSRIPRYRLTVQEVENG